MAAGSRGRCRLLWPPTPVFAALAHADDDRVRADLAGLPALLAMEDAGRLVAGRPAAVFALRVVPRYPRIPAVLPADWLPDAGPG